MAHAPGGDQAIDHIRISFRKTLGRIRRVTGEQQQRLVGRIGQRAGDDDLAAFLGIPGQLQVFVAEFAAARQVVGRQIIGQQVVHVVSLNELEFELERTAMVPRIRRLPAVVKTRLRNPPPISAPTKPLLLSHLLRRFSALAPE
jgi:hypothetical protein